MTFALLCEELVIAIHDRVLNPGELPGLAGDKSLDGALARVDIRLAFGMIVDVFDLAAASAVAIATGGCFIDGNKRTAYETMVVALELNGVIFETGFETVGPLLIEVAKGKVNDGDLAAWLRRQVG